MTTQHFVGTHNLVALTQRNIELEVFLTLTNVHTRDLNVW